MAVSTIPAGYVTVPYVLMDLFRDHYIWAVYACVYRHGYGSAQGCWASIKTMESETGVCHHKVRESLSDLVEAGFLFKVERAGTTTVYYVQDLAHAASRAQSFNELKGEKALQGNEEVVLQSCEGPPLQGCERPELQKSEGEQEPINKNPLTKTHEQYPVNPPFIPPSGGSGLPADRGWEEGSDASGVMAVVEPATGPPLAALAIPEQPASHKLVKAKRGSRKTDSLQPTEEEASRLMSVWNDNKPAGWSAITCVNQKRWEVAMGWARDLGGLEAFFEALPVALANASQDRFWSGPGHDWNSFMGYGGATSKGHFLRFLEQQEKREPTVNPDGSLTFLGSFIQTNQNPTPKFF
jgi:hypothetical protein